MPSCVACAAELAAAPPYTPHRLRQEPVPHRWTGLLPPPHHENGRGRRRHRRGEARRRPCIVEQPRPSTTGSTGADPMYAITLHQPWASLNALGIKTVETRSWPVPARLVGQRFAIHAGKRVVRRPGDAVERELRARLGDDWLFIIPAGTVLATAVLAGMAQVERADLPAGYVAHDPCTEVGCTVGTGRTPIDPSGDFSPGRWLWFLSHVRTLPVPAIGHQSFWHWPVAVHNRRP